MKQVTFKITKNLEGNYSAAVDYYFGKSSIGKSVWKDFATFDEAVNWLKKQEGVEM